MSCFDETKRQDFCGDLSVITPENLLQLISHSALSGELQVTTSSNLAVLLVENGALVFGYLKNNPMKIGRKLVNEDYITPEHLQECLNLHKDETSRPRIGQTLVEKGYLRQEDLEKIIREQVRSIFFEVLSWNEGSFSFTVMDISGLTDIFLQERMDHLILQGVVHLDERG